MSQPMKVVAMRQTCGACPAQWEGTLDDGRMFYVRYRWGWLSVCVSPEPTTDLYAAVGGDEVVGIQHGDEYDGYMDAGTMCQLASPAFDFSALRAVGAHPGDRT